MRILVCGGTGFIGRHIVDSLKQAGHEPVQRSRRTAPPLDFSKALTAEAWLPHLAGIDAVINAVGVLRDSAGRPLQAMHADAPIALFDACAAAGVRRVVQISALGIAHSATRYASTKRAADEHLLALTEQGRLNGCVLRPSVVFGAGGASSQLFLALARLPACCCRARCCKRACSPWPCATWPTRWRAWRVRMRRRAWSRSADPRPCRWRS